MSSGDKSAEGITGDLPTAKQHLTETLPDYTELWARIFDAAHAKDTGDTAPEELKGPPERIKETLEKIATEAGVSSSFSHDVGNGMDLGYDVDSAKIYERVTGIAVGNMAQGTVLRSISEADIEKPWVQRLLTEADVPNIGVIKQPPQ